MCTFSLNTCRVKCARSLQFVPEFYRCLQPSCVCSRNRHGLPVHNAASHLVCRKLADTIEYWSRRFHSSPAQPTVVLLLASVLFHGDMCDFSRGRRCCWMNPVPTANWCHIALVVRSFPSCPGTSRPWPIVRRRSDDVSPGPSLVPTCLSPNVCHRASRRYPWLFERAAPTHPACPRFRNYPVAVR